jgi:hypothetical protein
METVAPLQVRRRRVFYIPGYDPIHPRRYRELYRREGAEQAKISGYTIDLSPKKTAATYGWHVDASIGGQTVAADVDVLVWSDIVRASMAASIPATYGQLVRTAWTYISSGALRRLMWLRKGPVIAALYPVGMLLLQLVLALGAGAIAAALALWGLNAALGGTGWGTGTVTPFLRWPIVLIVAMLLLRWFKAQDGRIYAHYLMHDYAFSARWGGAYPPALETRMAAFGDLIATALTGEYDEVLVVGHSSGCDDSGRPDPCGKGAVNGAGSGLHDTGSGGADVVLPTPRRPFACRSVLSGGAAGTDLGGCQRTRGWLFLCPV